MRVEAQEENVKRATLDFERDGQFTWIYISEGHHHFVIVRVGLFLIECA